jgi:hypothetical protein
MIKNYFKIPWRNLIKNRTSSSINIGNCKPGKKFKNGVDMLMQKICKCADDYKN